MPEALAHALFHAEKERLEQLQPRIDRVVQAVERNPWPGIEWELTFPITASTLMYDLVEDWLNFHCIEVTLDSVDRQIEEIAAELKVRVDLFDEVRRVAARLED